MSSLGHQLRLARVLDPATRTSIVLPMDHALEEPDIAELEDPRALIGALADEGVDAFLLRRGLARFAAAEFAGKAGFVQRLTGRTGLSSDHNEQLVLAGVEQAYRNGADAVVPTFFIGQDTEADALPHLGRISDECAQLGLPLLAEVFPVGGASAHAYDGPYSVDEMRIAVRVASEEGADLIKTWYTGDPESFASVLEYAFVPVIVAGGASGSTPRDVFQFTYDAISAGAAGVAMGRKIWQAEDPVGVLRGVRRIVRERATVEQALEGLGVGAEVA
jgi:fructose-bisphosphate aldolase/2-amino-3,7-dideoxy-D-threo-hept-6-ulosonate synthase